MVDVTYMELVALPASVGVRHNAERVSAERLSIDEYLMLYRRVGEPLRWDQRLRMPVEQLETLLASGLLSTYVLRNAADGEALGFCEFDRTVFPEIELKNFGLIPEAYGQGFGARLLGIGLKLEWATQPIRIWLHTDTWDHPAAVPLYKKMGFRVIAVKREPVNGL